MLHTKGRLTHALAGLLATLTVWLALPARPRAAPMTEEHTVSARPTPAVHDNPRLKLSFRQLSIANLDGSTVPLTGGQLDVYPLSRRWIRLGLELEGGTGGVSLEGAQVDLWYALAGISLGLQYPARVTPFVEGRFAAGVLGGNLARSLAIVPGLSLSQARAATDLLVGGIDVGVEVYVVSRVYLTLAVGWAHPVYTGVDLAAIMANPTGGLSFKQIAADTFTFKVGLGI